jgi:hypothetical protein
MLSSIHFLVTYACNFECEHCFLYCSPQARGTFTLEQIRAALDQIKQVPSIDAVCFEGGEPMLYFPLVLEAITQAHARGLKSGIVTNAYWATSEEDAALWLRPIFERGLTSVSISDDSLHYGDPPGIHAQRVQAAAEKIGMSAKVLCTQPPTVVRKPPNSGMGVSPMRPTGVPPVEEHGLQVPARRDATRPEAVPPAVGGADSDGEGELTVGGGVMFRGRAVEKLAAGLPRRPCGCFASCSRENLADPKRVHVDCFGNLHLCQGLLLGNIYKTPLAELLKSYDPQSHPIVGPLLRGGPAELARAYGLPHEDAYIDECHFCHMMRLALLDRFPDYLAPRQVYGLK